MVVREDPIGRVTRFIFNQGRAMLTTPAGCPIGPKHQGDRDQGKKKAGEIARFLIHSGFFATLTMAGRSKRSLML